METNWQWLDDITETEVKDAPLPMKQVLEDSMKGQLSRCVKYMLVDEQLDNFKRYWTEYPKLIEGFGELRFFANITKIAELAVTTIDN